MKRRPLALVGALLVVAAGCSNPPTRERTDADVLVELHGTRATITLNANNRGLSFSPLVEPRGGPPTTTTSTTEPAPPTPEQIAEAQAAFAQALSGPHSDITHDIRDPRTTLADIGEAFEPGATVTAVRVTPNRIVGTVRFARPLDDPVDVHPAVLARALDRGGLSRRDTVWVGVCVPSTQGRWSSTTDAFDRALGCTGWVPDRRAASVGILVPGPRPSPVFWPGVAIGLAALGLGCLVVARIRIGARRWYAPVAVVLALMALGAAIALFRLGRIADDLPDTFATKIDGQVVSQSHLLIGPGVLLGIIGLGAAAWFATDRDRHRVRRPSAFDDQPEKRSLRGSSV